MTKSMLNIPIQTNILILSNKMLNDADKSILIANAYDNDDTEISPHIASYCINQKNQSEFIVYDLKYSCKRENISENLENIINFANDMHCSVIGFTKSGAFPTYIKLTNVEIPTTSTRPDIRRIYSPSLMSLNENDIAFLNKLVKENPPGLYEKYRYGWFIDTSVKETLKILCKNKHVKKIIAPYIDETMILDFDSGT